MAVAEAVSAVTVVAAVVAEVCSSHTLLPKHQKTDFSSQVASAAVAVVAAVVSAVTAAAEEALVVVPAVVPVEAVVVLVVAEVVLPAQRVARRPSL